MSTTPASPGQLALFDSPDSQISVEQLGAVIARELILGVVTEELAAECLLPCPDRAMVHQLLSCAPSVEIERLGAQVLPEKKSKHLRRRALTRAVNSACDTFIAEFVGWR